MITLADWIQDYSPPRRTRPQQMLTQQLFLLKEGTTTMQERILCSSSIINLIFNQSRKVKWLWRFYTTLLLVMDHGPKVVPGLAWSLGFRRAQALISRLQRLAVMKKFLFRSNVNNQKVWKISNFFYLISLTFGQK